MGYLLAVNRTIRGKLPKDATPGQWARFNDAFENVELSAGEIAAEIRAGHAISAQHTGRRKAANWLQAQHIGIDLDDGTLSWDEIVSLPLVADHAAIVHTTASHTPEHGRYRVLFLLEDAVPVPDTYTMFVGCMLRSFNTADPHCKDASRLFFGAPDCALLLAPSNVLTSEDLLNLVFAYPPPEWADPPGGDDDRDPRPDPRPSRPPAGGDIVPPDRISARRLAAHSDALLRRIATAPDGAKWATLRDTAITFGGYVAGGYYSENEARRWLRTAIEGRRATVGSMKHAYNTIDLGLAYGELSPLYYTRGDDAPGAPPAVDTRAELRHALIADRLAELERLINAADVDAADFPTWVEEYDALQKALC